MVKGWKVKTGSGLSVAFAFGQNFVLFGRQNYEEILITRGKDVFEKKKKKNMNLNLGRAAWKAT
jgi:hypothetical protein